MIWSKYIEKAWQAEEISPETWGVLSDRMQVLLERIQASLSLDEVCEIVEYDGKIAASSPYLTASRSTPWNWLDGAITISHSLKSVEVNSQPVVLFDENAYFEGEVLGANADPLVRLTEFSPPQSMSAGSYRFSWAPPERRQMVSPSQDSSYAQYLSEGIYLSELEPGRHKATVVWQVYLIPDTVQGINATQAGKSPMLFGPFDLVREFEYWRVSDPQEVWYRVPPELVVAEVELVRSGYRFEVDSLGEEQHDHGWVSFSFDRIGTGVDIEPALVGHLHVRIDGELHPVSNLPPRLRRNGDTSMPTAITFDEPPYWRASGFFSNGIAWIPKPKDGSASIDLVYVPDPERFTLALANDASKNDGPVPVLDAMVVWEDIPLEGND